MSNEYPLHFSTNTRADSTDTYSFIKHEDRSDKYKKRISDLAIANSERGTNNLVANSHPLWFVVGIPLSVLGILLLVF